MLPDPIAIGSLEWREIGALLHNLWFYLCLIVTFAVTMLTAHAIIPSLISTGHLPRSAGLLRFSLTVTALVILAFALTVLSMAVNMAYVIETFYDRFWI
jgi:hypothetical protein